MPLSSNSNSSSRGIENSFCLIKTKMASAKPITARMFFVLIPGRNKRFTGKKKKLVARTVSMTDKVFIIVGSGFRNKGG